MSQGGAERQLSYLAIGLKKDGHDVRLIKFYNGVNAYKPDLDKQGIYTEIYTNGKNAFKRPFVIANIIKKWQPQMVIAYKDGACMASCMARCLTTFNLIVSERNTTQHLSIRERLKFQLYRKANKVVPNSFSQDRFIKCNAPWLKDKLKVISNMIDLEKFYPSNKDLNLNYIPHIITVGRISRQKNVKTYLKAIHLIKKHNIKCHFSWWGHPESEEYYAEVQNLAAELNISDFITFHAGSQDIANIYREATHFCLPSTYEGFPNVLCEAMASGLVCTASNICDNPYILNNPKRLFNPEDPISIANCLIKSLSISKSEQHKEGYDNCLRIRNLCSPNIFIKEYENLLNF